MFSYQHIFHAGNSADIFKHASLCFIMDSLCRKNKPFTVIDSHAGRGLYNLHSEEAEKTGEAKNGIEKLVNSVFTEKNGKLDFTEYKRNIPEIIKTYLDKEKLYYQKNLYAGSPELLKLYTRSQDSIFLVEKHPQEIISLKENASKEIHVPSEFSEIIPGFKKSEGKIFIHEKDSYEALKALTPPLVKRGLVFTDPSYESTEDYVKVRQTLSLVHKKWNTAVIALWYPILTIRQHQLTQMLTGLEDDIKLNVNSSEFINVEFSFKKSFAGSNISNAAESNSEQTRPVENDIHAGESHMYGCGMFVINPPWHLKENLEEAAEFLQKIF